MTPHKFESWRKTIYKELIAAYTHYHIWEQLWPTEEHILIINQFPVFFHYTTAAHMKQFILSITKITEHRDNSINLWRWLDGIENDQSLASRLSTEVKQLRAQLESHNDILGRIRKYRNKIIAHIDERHAWPDDNLWQDKVITVGEAKALLQDLESGFNVLSLAYDRYGGLLKTAGLGDTSSLFKELLSKPTLEDFKY